MTTMKEIICIECPKGCKLQVDEKNGYSVTGNQCKRGAVYGKAEITNPQRMVSSTVRISGAIYPRLPVVTSKQVSKKNVFDVMEALNKVHVKAPIKVGNVILENVCGTGADIIASRTYDKVVE